jgi:hypothetical protein
VAPDRKEQARQAILARREAAKAKAREKAERIARYRELEAEAHRQAMIRKEAKLAAKQVKKDKQKETAPVAAKQAAEASVVVVKKKRRYHDKVRWIAPRRCLASFQSTSYPPVS